MTTILFESDRLYFREPNAADAAEMHAEAVRVWPQLRAWMSWASMEDYSHEDALYFVTDFTVQECQKGGLMLMGFHKDTDKLVVVTGLTASDAVDEYSTGYWVTAQHLGKGYATEATKAVLKFAFEQHGAKTMHIMYFEGNEKSRRVIEKCGFQYLKTLPKHHQSFVSGKWLDKYVYTLTNKQWRQQPCP